MHGRLVDGWADGGSGHGAAAPPSSATSDRLFTAGPFRASERKNSTPQLRQEAVALRDFNFRYDRSGVNLSHPAMSVQYPDYPATSSWHVANVPGAEHVTGRLQIDFCSHLVRNRKCPS